VVEGIDNVDPKNTGHGDLPSPRVDLKGGDFDGQYFQLRRARRLFTCSPYRCFWKIFELSACHRRVNGMW